MTGCLPGHDHSVRRQTRTAAVGGSLPESPPTRLNLFQSGPANPKIEQNHAVYGTASTRYPLITKPLHPVNALELAVPLGCLAANLGVNLGVSV